MRNLHEIVASDLQTEEIKKLNKRCDVIAEALNEIDVHYERENHAIDEVLSEFDNRLTKIEEKLDYIIQGFKIFGK